MGRGKHEFKDSLGQAETPSAYLSLPQRLNVKDDVLSESPAGGKGCEWEPPVHICVHARVPAGSKAGSCGQQKTGRPGETLPSEAAGTACQEHTTERPDLRVSGSRSVTCRSRASSQKERVTVTPCPCAHAKSRPNAAAQPQSLHPLGRISQPRAQQQERKPHCLRTWLVTFVTSTSGPTPPSDDASLGGRQMRSSWWSAGGSAHDGVPRRALHTELL